MLSLKSEFCKSDHIKLVLLNRLLTILEPFTVAYMTKASDISEPSKVVWTNQIIQISAHQY